MGERQDESDETTIRRRQDQLLSSWIAERAHDPEDMTFVFSLAAGLAYNRRRAPGSSRRESPTDVEKTSKLDNNPASTRIRFPIPLTRLCLWPTKPVTT